MRSSMITCSNIASCTVFEHILMVAWATQMVCWLGLFVSLQLRRELSSH